MRMNMAVSAEVDGSKTTRISIAKAPAEALNEMEGNHHDH